MANVFEKGTKFASTAVELLKKTIKLPQIFVYKYGSADFVGAAGDTINIKRPPLLRATDKGWRSSNAIAVSDISQSRIQVSLNQFPYNAVHLSPEEETLDEVDYVRDVQVPQVQAMGEYYENAVISTLQGAAYVFEIVYNPDAGDSTAATQKLSDPRKVASRARKYFQDAKVPMAGRYWLVGSSVAEAIRDFGKLLDIDTSGLPEALREGVVTKLSGFWVIEVDGLAETESYFVHETAVAIANAAPVVPKGAIGGASATGPGGIAITQIWDYDATNAKDRSIVESFVGGAVVEDPQVGSDGLIVKDGNGDPVMDFYRAIKVLFGTPASTESSKWTIAVTGSPTGGTFTLLIDEVETGDIAYNASNAAIATAINALDGVDGVKVTGTTTKTLIFTEPVLVTADAALTGGTTPGVTVTKV